METRPRTHEHHWQAMTMVHLAHGQARPYAPHVDLVEVTFTGGHPATDDPETGAKREFPWGTCPPSHATLVKQHVKGYVGWSYDKTLGETGEFHEKYLAECEHVRTDPENWSNTWRLKVVEPFLD